MALEVLRELDEADAMYFALAIQSPASLEHLVRFSAAFAREPPNPCAGTNSVLTCLTLVLGIG